MKTLRIATRYLLVGLVLLLISGCSFIEQSTMHDFSDGTYKYRKPGDKPEKVYLTVNEDTLKWYPVVKMDGRNMADTSKPGEILLKDYSREDLPRYGRLSKTTLDMDLLTVIFKYRFEQKEMPNQLNSNFNAAIYLGYRKDYFNLVAFRSPMHVYRVRRVHFGFDAGIFAGFGSSAINPWVTGNQIESEYDGFVFQKGIGAFFGAGAFGFGLVLGFDTLLDENKKYWIYNEKPYIGFAVGLTLN